MTETIDDSKGECLDGCVSKVERHIVRTLFVDGGFVPYVVCGTCGKLVGRHWDEQPKTKGRRRGKR